MNRLIILFLLLNTFSSKVLSQITYTERLPSKWPTSYVQTSFEDQINNQNINWIYHTGIKIELPEDLRQLAEKLYDKAINNEVRVNGFMDNKEILLEKNYIIIDDTDAKNELVNSTLQSENLIYSLLLDAIPDTIVRMNPITLEYEETICHDYYLLVNDEIRLNEIWFFDKTSKRLYSKVNSIFNYFEMYSCPGATYVGHEKIYAKENGTIKRNYTTFQIERNLDFDTICNPEIPPIEYSKPLKILYNKSFSELIWDNLDEFKLIDKKGEIFENPANEIEWRDTFSTVNPITLAQENYVNTKTVSWKSIVYFKILEEWKVDLEGINIEKEIVAITPVFKNDLDPNTRAYNYNEFSFFTILFD